MRLMLGLLLLALAACDTASVPLADSQANAAGKRFDPPPRGQGQLYVYRLGDVGTLVGVTVGARNVGQLGNYSWFKVAVPPGPADVRCVGGEDSKQAMVMIADGETRFVEVAATTGWWAARCTVVEVPAEQGRAGVLRGSRAAELR